MTSDLVGALVSGAKVFIDGEFYEWNQGGFTFEEGSREYGRAIVATVGSMYDISTVLMKDYLKGKAESFPEWGGLPQFKVGPPIRRPYLIKLDGGEIDPEVREEYVEYTSAVDAFQEEWGYDENLPRNLQRFDFPEGYGVDYELYPVYAWYAVVPKEACK